MIPMPWAWSDRTTRNRLSRSFSPEQGGRLVHDQDAGLPVERLGDLDELLLGNRQRRDLGIDRELDTQRVEDLARPGLDRRPVHGPSLGGQVAEEDVLGDGEVAGEVELLVDGRDAQRLGVVRAADLDGLSLEQDLPLVLAVRTREDLDQGRLAGAILAEEGVDLALLDRQLDAFERPDAGERLPDALHLQQDVTRGGGTTHRDMPPDSLLAAVRQRIDGNREDHERRR